MARQLMYTIVYANVASQGITFSHADISTFIYISNLQAPPHSDTTTIKSYGLIMAKSTRHMLQVAIFRSRRRKSCLDLRLFENFHRVQI